MVAQRRRLIVTMTSAKAEVDAALSKPDYSPPKQVIIRQGVIAMAARSKKSSSKSTAKSASPEAQLKALIGRFDAKHQKLIRSVRAGLRKRLPTANELVYDYPGSLVIGYSPSMNGIESIVSTAARKSGVELYFNFGPRLPDPKKLLQGSGKATRFVTLDSAARLEHPDIEAFIAAAESLSTVRMRSTGKGAVIIKSNKSPGGKKKAGRAKAKKRSAS